MTEFDINKTDQGVRVLHNDDGSLGPGKCGFDYENVEGHGWLRTDRDEIIDSHAREEDIKLCEDCYVGDVLVRNYNK